MADIMEKKEVVVVLPYVDGKILMQLRDFNPGISFPGQWGFWGGSIENGERPKEAAGRELFEEISYKTEVLYEIDTEMLPNSDDVIIHSFFCFLKIPVELLILNEGMDMGLFSIEEVLSKMLYSKEMKNKFPIVPTGIIETTIKKLCVCLKKMKHL
tara:strand:+ start:2287 stop:2754 length:468 start_codon:yes stop_codon:yes gene_type:complete